MKYLKWQKIEFIQNQYFESTNLNVNDYKNLMTWVGIMDLHVGIGYSFHLSTLRVLPDVKRLTPPRVTIWIN